jgi:hypothetical protein
MHFHVLPQPKHISDETKHSLFSMKFLLIWVHSNALTHAMGYTKKANLQVIDNVNAVPISVAIQLSSSPYCRSAQGIQYTYIMHL